MRIAPNGIRYLVRGTGPTVVLIHGFPLTHALWLDQMTVLAEDAEVVAVDLRGFGESPRMGSQVLSMERHASDIDLILDDLAVDTAHLVGLSMGGYVALAYAELFGQRMESLVLSNTKATADTDAAREGRDAVAERVVTEGVGPLAADLSAALMTEKASLTARARFRSMAEGLSYESYVGALAGMRDRVDRTAVLSEIQVPTTVITGAEDSLMPLEGAEALAAAIPGAELTVIDGCGHLPPLEAPDAMSDALVDHFARL